MNYFLFNVKWNIIKLNNIWRPPCINELTPIIFDMELTHFGLEARSVSYWSYMNRISTSFVTHKMCHTITAQSSSILTHQVHHSV